MRSVLLRYWLLQMPAILLLAVVLRWMHEKEWIGAAPALLILVLWILKDAVLFPFVRKAYETRNPSPYDQLAGKRGVIVRRARGHLFVRVEGELWRAELAEGESEEPGTAVFVEECEGMTLRVRGEQETTEKIPPPLPG